MEETVGNLNKDQLTRLARYFDEKVTYPTKYKSLRATLSRPALRGSRRKIGSDEGLATGGSGASRCPPFATQPRVRRRNDRS